MKLFKKVSQNIRSTSIALGVVVASISTTFSMQSSADAILHAFNWEYSDVANRATEIANIGYKKVLVAPPLKSGSNCAWWARYQPQDYRVIDHCLGNTQTFQAMIASLQTQGVEVYADIVLNHMANERNGATDFPGSATLQDYANNSAFWNNQRIFGDLSQGLFGSGDFHMERCISDFNNVFQVQNYRLCGGPGDRGLPDLDPNDWVRQQQRNYLQALKDMGVTGFRVDAAKHMTNFHINAVFTDQIKQGMHVFGEVITGGGTSSGDFQSFLAPYLSGTDHDAYDFPLLNAMRGAFGFGGSMRTLDNPVASGNALVGTRAITFPITHDIPTNDGFRFLIMNPTDEHLAYAYILGRQDGSPLVFSDQTGVDNGRWVNDYRQADIRAMVKFHNEVQGADQETLYVDDCILVFRRGVEGLVGINKCGNSRAIELQTDGRFNWFRDYEDVFTGEVFSISSSRHTINVPGRSARMWYLK